MDWGKGWINDPEKCDWNVVSPWYEFGGQCCQGSGDMKRLLKTKVLVTVLLL